MSWYVSGNDLQMAEGDYGVELPITISGMEFVAGDCVKLTIKTAKNGDAVLTRDFTTITQNTIILELTEAESALLRVGSYVYRLDAYQNGNYLNNIIPLASFKVVDVA